MSTDTELQIKEGEDGSAEVELDKVTSKDDEDAEGGEKKAVEERTTKSPSEDTASYEDEIAAAPDEAAREAIRARRREERSSRRQKRREYTASLETQVITQGRELAELKQQMGLVARRSTGTELAQLDGEITTAEKTYSELKEIIADASTQQKGDIVADATERMIKVNAYVENLKRVKETYLKHLQTTASVAAPSQQRMQPVFTPEAAKKYELGTQWLAKHAWYNAKGTDLDSRLVREIDNSVLADGFDPTTDDYWDEMSDRVARYLPHRAGVANGADSGQNGSTTTQRSVRRTGVSGSGKEAAGNGSASKTTFKLSPERVKAVKDAGFWEDPKKRAEMIRDYAAYDAAQKAQSDR